MLLSRAGFKPLIQSVDLHGDDAVLIRMLGGHVKGC